MRKILRDVQVWRRERMVSKLSRRDFLKGAAATGVGVCANALPIGAIAAAPGKSRVVIVTSPKVIVDPEKNTHSPAPRYLLGQSDPSIDVRTVDRMLSEAMMAFAGTESAEAAWKKLFKPTDVVGIKINCLFGKGVSTHPEVVAAVIMGLKLAGISDENIIVWDRNDREMIRSGYRINRDSGVKCYGTEGEYEPEPTKAGSFGGRMSKILTQKITALINVPILKDHGISGITCAMKNHYGSHDNPGDHHANGCDPFLADLNSVRAIREKTRLIVCDAIKPLANGGPGPRPEYIWEQKSLIVSADPVAVDYHGWQMIEARRKEIGLPSLAEAGRPTRFLDTAASKGLGTNDPEKMEIIRKTV